MAKAGLTSRYRPQTFARVAGQEYIKTILSRAAAQDRPSHAYLFSGTRGVGKTTVARILAKAINCRNGPDFEPCNQCPVCEQVTQGASPDVWEIDGASHTGVDHVRKLREDVFYTPMSTRYKVIIIDEAHMLSNSAFNALLKTLEEPPGHCVFILATTAPEKFPATVISRCQQHAFKRLTQKELVQHLEWVLESEGISYQDEAVRLLAQRGSGSVRDSMSLLGQVLDLGEQGLQGQSVRRILGLAGQEVYQQLVRDILNQDLPRLHNLVRYLLDQGLDLGFFLQELAQCWRNLFLLSKGGKEAKDLLDLAPEESEFWLQMAGEMPVSRIHAGWQMILEGRKSILSSYEPGISLELLLYNLAYLPELIPVSAFDPEASDQEKQTQAKASENRDAREGGGSSSSTPESRTEQNAIQEPRASFDFQGETQDWQGFLEFCAGQSSDDPALVNMLKQCQGRLEQEQLVLFLDKEPVRQGLMRNSRKEKIASLAKRYLGRDVEVHFESEPDHPQPQVTLEQKVKEHPGVQKILDEFDAKIVKVTRKKPNSDSKEEKSYAGHD